MMPGNIMYIYAPGMEFGVILVFYLCVCGKNFTFEL